MSKQRLILLAASAAVILLVVGGSLAVRVGAADTGYGQVVLFSEVLQLIEDNYVDPVDPDALLSGAYDGMLGGLDAHGAFLSPAALRAWKAGPKTSDVGPGVSVLKGYGGLTIVDVAAGSSAEETGLQRGDRIRRINDTPLRDLSLDQCLRLLRGPAGSRITLSVVHPERGFRHEDVEVVRAARSDPAFNLTVDADTAVLAVHDLRRLAPAAVASEIRKTAGQGAARLLLDLRNLADGTPRDAMGLVGLFTKGVVLRLVDRAGETRETLRTRGAPAWSGPMGVLVNGATAGGGEALAVVLHENVGARILGHATYGLGAEPKLFELQGGTGMLVSAYVWETPRGTRWQEDGVEPERVISGDGRGKEADGEQLRRAVDALRELTTPARAA